MFISWKKVLPCLQLINLQNKPNIFNLNHFDALKNTTINNGKLFPFVISFHALHLSCLSLDNQDVRRRRARGTHCGAQLITKSKAEI